MVAVKNHEADRYIASPPKAIAVFLVFGSDAGLISERVAGIISRVIEDRHDPFQMVTMNGDDVADDPGQLIEEVDTIGLFQAKRVIHIVAGRKSFIEALKILLDEPPNDCCVVISAGALRGDTPLRTMCARSKIAVAIECFPDQDRDIVRLIDEELRSSGQTMTADARAALVGSLGADRLSTRSEIEKLILYAHGKSQITEDDVYLMIADASGEKFDDALDAAFSGKRNEATEVFSQVAETGEDLNLLISACIRRCILLHRMLLEIESGTAQQLVLEKFNQARIPPVRKTNLVYQLKRWDSFQIAALLSRVQTIAFEFREKSGMAQMICARLLWIIASMRPAR